MRVQAFSRREVVNRFLSFQFPLKDITFLIKLSTGKACSSSFHLRLLSLFCRFLSFRIALCARAFSSTKRCLKFLAFSLFFVSVRLVRFSFHPSRKRLNFYISSRAGVFFIQTHNQCNGGSHRRLFFIPTRFLHSPISPPGRVKRRTTTCSLSRR